MITGLSDAETLERTEVPRCSDHDDDCSDVEDKVHCYLYDPAKGYCPYLRAALASVGE